MHALLADSPLDVAFPLLVVLALFLLWRKKAQQGGKQPARAVQATSRKASARNWKLLRSYCRICGNWWSTNIHCDCPKGERGTRIFVDINNFELGCSKCGQVWAIENTETECLRGHVQRTEYVDSTVVIEAGDQVIASDGNMVYVLKRTGTVVVGRRSYLDVGYEN